MRGREERKTERRRGLEDTDREAAAQERGK